MSVCGNSGLAAPGLWVDFGRRHFALSLLLPESGGPSHGGTPASQMGTHSEHAPAPDLVEVGYDTLAGATLAVQASGGAARL